MGLGPRHKDIGLKRIEALLALAMSRSSRQSAKAAWRQTVLQVDPQNASGLASDRNSGLVGAPILSTAEMNRRLFNVDVQVSTAISFLSDDLSGTVPDLTTQSYHAPGQLNFRGIPRVVRSSNLTGQQTIVPTTNTRQQVTDPAAGGWAAGIAGLRYVESKTAPHVGARTWLVSTTGAPANSANCSRVTDATGLAAGALGALDAYDEKRGSFLLFPMLAGYSFQELAAVTFQDFHFTSAPNGAPAIIEGNVLPQFVNCAFEDFVTGNAFATFNNCHAAGGFFMDTGSTVVILTAGVVRVLIVGQLNVSGDTYFTDGPVILGPGAVSLLQVSPGIGAGAQFQDIATPLAALVASQGTYDVGASSDGGLRGLLWGSGNTLGVFLQAGATLFVSGDAGTIPVLTGTAPTPDFQFRTSHGGPSGLFARPWDDGANAYGAAAACSWANFAGAALNFNAHFPATGAHLIGI